ncbi:MAG: winged helix-turn-helix domain-containing protein [Acidilobaceae archaeon]
MSLEDVVSSKGKLKILKILMKRSQANITRIVRETGLRYELALRHLEELKKMGLVEERRYGRLRIFEINHRNPRVGLLKEVIDILEKV